MCCANYKSDFLNFEGERFFYFKLSLNKICEGLKNESEWKEYKILNRYPIKDNKKLKENDQIILIKKGEILDINEVERLLVARHTPNIHSKLKKGKIVILGLAGLGYNIAISVAKIGVGELNLVDFDIVEPSNLNRQQYFIEDIGKYKTVAMSENISKINPFIKIKIYNMVASKENINKFNYIFRYGRLL